MDKSLDLDSNRICVDLRQFYEATYHKVVYDSICNDHVKLCKQVKKKGNLVLIIREECVKFMEKKFQVKLSEKKDSTYSAIAKLLTDHVAGDQYQRPHFYNLKPIGKQILVQLRCNSEQALSMLKKRTNFKGRAGLNWVFPGSRDFKLCLNLLVQKSLCKKWYLSATGCRIMLVLRDAKLHGKEYFHLVNSSLEIAGILASCNNEAKTLALVKKPKLVYALEKIISYNAKEMIGALEAIETVTDEDLEEV